MEYKSIGTCITTVVTYSKQLSARSLEIHAGVAYPIAETMSGLNPSSLLDFCRSIIANNDAVAPPRE